jgi:disulfide bond formation protein DsbB
MTLDQFSTFITICSTLLFVGVLGVLIASLVSPNIKAKVVSLGYRNHIIALAAVAIISTLGSLTFQMVYNAPVCELCWWQRIFMYPMVVITLVSLWRKAKEAHIMTGILAVFGVWYASYHYYYHFKGFVLGQKLTLPCSYGGLMPACTDSPILIFGFSTIPFMSLMAFGSILMLSFLAYRALRYQQSSNQN